MLDPDINYIVSGLERSGTSVMMQMLSAGGVPVAFDESRPADEHNPKGYYELAGGKVINRLMEGTIDLNSYKGKVLKVTAYGLKFLPYGKYEIIYMTRDMDEVLASMEKMGAGINREKDVALFSKLNLFAFDLMENRGDIDFVTVKYRDVIENPRKAIEKVASFLGEKIEIELAIEAVDSKLYRNRASN